MRRARNSEHFPQTTWGGKWAKTAWFLQVFPFSVPAPTVDSWPPPLRGYLEGNPLRSGPLGCQPVPSLSLPLPAKTHMPAGLAVVPAFGDGIEGLLAAHAHGDFLLSDGCRCPLPKIYVLERGPGPRSEIATPQPSPASPCPLPEGLDHQREAADTFRRPAFESLL